MDDPNAKAFLKSQSSWSKTLSNWKDRKNTNQIRNSMNDGYFWIFSPICNKFYFANFSHEHPILLLLPHLLFNRDSDIFFHILFCPIPGKWLLSPDLLRSYIQFFCINDGPSIAQTHTHTHLPPTHTFSVSLSLSWETHARTRTHNTHTHMTGSLIML